MTVSSQTNRISYTGNDTTTAFAFPYEFNAGTDLKVYKAGTLQTITTHYTVSGGSGSSGTVTFVTAPTSGQSIVIYDDPPVTQALDYIANDPFPAESHESGLDKLTRIERRTRDLVTRSFRLPDSYAGSASTELPTPEADKFLTWNGTATALVNRSADDLVTIAAYAAWQSQKFTGNGVQTAFTLSSDPGNIANVDIHINGVSQVATDDYTLSGTTLTFTSAPPNGSVIFVRWGQALPQATAALEGYLADTSDVSRGDAMIGVKRTETGAVATNLHIWIQQQKATVENFPTLQDALNSGAKILRLTENKSLSAGVTIPAGVTLEGNGKANVAVTCTANITPFTMSSVNDAGIEGVLIIAHASQTAPLILLDAASATMARCRVRDVQGSGSATDFPFISVRTRNGAYGSWAHEFHDISVSGCGTVVKCETQFAGSWINSLKASHVHANDFIRGVHLIATAGDGCADSTFLDWATQTSARTQFGALIADVSAQGISRKNSFTDVRFYDLIASALGFYIGSNVLDTAIQGLTVDDLIPSRIRDLGVGTRIHGMLVPEYMVRGGREVRPPTNAGLTAAVTGTGTTQALAQYAQLRSGATAGSVARLYSSETLSGLSQNQLFNIDFGKPLVFTFLCTRITSGGSAVGRVQIKQVTTDGSLAAAGLGLQINNYDLFGESYGSGLATVNLGVAMADAQTYRIDIVHYPGVRVEWWVNGVLKGEQTTAANIPSGAVAAYFHASVENVTAVDVQLFFNSMRLAASN